ncbi:MAG: hypothetical protein RBT70_09515, partial [Alphaproteobacteria bacterium]|nr:hypothetical protein [Alphaproteobacteria bacterium]
YPQCVTKHSALLVVRIRHDFAAVSKQLFILRMMVDLIGIEPPAVAQRAEPIKRSLFGRMLVGIGGPDRDRTTGGCATRRANKKESVRQNVGGDWWT